MTVKKKKGTLVALGPLQTFPEVKQVDTICSIQTAAGKGKPRRGAPSDVSFLLARSVSYQHLPYFNPSKGPVN